MRFHPLKYAIYFIVISMPFRSISQTPLLERPITLRVNNEKISTVLDNISKQGSFSFSYNSAIFDVNNRGDLTVQNKPVREVLNLIFKGIITYKVRGNYIILQKNTRQKYTKTIIVSGYIIDTQTDKPLSKATVYDPKSLSSTVSNDYGFYRIKLNINNLPTKLIITKADYEKRIINIKSSQDTYEVIELTPIIYKPFDIPVYEDNSIEKRDNHLNQDLSLESKTISQPVAPPFPDITDQNLFPTSPIIDSTLYDSRWDEFKKKVGKVFVSRSQRINAQNVDDYLVRKFQVSLLPFLGTNRLLSGSIENDYSLNLLMGYSGGVRKLEVGGILNGVRNDVQGLQLAGVGNIVGGSVVGGQISSTFNIAGYLDNGMQLSSGFNVIIRKSNGWQIAPINFAHRVVEGGKQIGFINISDSTATVPIGFLSFVGNGYKRLELSVDENQTSIISFKTGVRKFYNVLALHYNFTRTQEIFGLGYGIGRAYELGKSWMFNTDLTANVLVEYDDLSPNVGSLWKLDVSFEKQIARNAAVTFGPSIKYLIIDEYNSSSWTAKPFNKIPTYKSISSTTNSTLWIGFQMGLRIRSKRN